MSAGAPQNLLVYSALKAYQRTTLGERARGRRFYPEAKLLCEGLAWRYAVSPDVVAGMMAALSPNNSWAMNKRGCELALRGEWSRVPMYKRDVRKAREILEGPGESADIERVLRGPKTIAFYRLMRDGRNEYDVCVDGHMANVLRGQGMVPMKSVKLTREEFDRFAAVVRVAAKRVGMAPCELQATLWIAWRASSGLRQGRLELGA